jgi:hypothetical protein
VQDDAWHCAVDECGFPHLHITSSHKCGTCGRYGHGQLECGDENATAALALVKAKLPPKLHCSLPECSYPAAHVSAGHQCGECRGFGHSVPQCEADPAAADQGEDDIANAQTEAAADAEAEADAGDDEDEDDEDDLEKNDGADVDITGCVLDLPEPQYQKAFLKTVCERGSQFTSLRAQGDWECWLDDLHTVLPHLVNCSNVELEIQQSGCGGVDEVVAKVALLPQLESLDMGNSYEGESMQPLMNLLSGSNRLKTLAVAFDQGNEDDEEGVVQAIGEGIRNGGSALVEFNGCELKAHLALLGLDGPEAAGSALETNAQILHHLHSVAQN